MQQNDRLRSYWGEGGEGLQKGRKQKISEWGLPGVENVATSLESLFMLSRAPQHPYIKKSKKSKINYSPSNLIKIPPISPYWPRFGAVLFSEIRSPEIG